MGGQHLVDQLGDDYAGDRLPAGSTKWRTS